MELWNSVYKLYSVVVEIEKLLAELINGRLKEYDRLDTKPSLNEIKIPSAINIAGFKIKVLINADIDKELQELKVFGHWCCGADGKYIKLDGSIDASEISNTFIHECIEAVNSIYLDHTLKEKEINAVANGLHQIFEGMKVRFVK